MILFLLHVVKIRTHIWDGDHPTFVKTFSIRRLEMKIREMESKLELELTTRGRLDTQIARSG